MANIAIIGPQEVAQRIQDAAEHGRTWLDLSDAGLRELPEQVLDLEQLQFILLSRNNLETLPERLAQLPKLGHVGLCGNPIRSLPRLSRVELDAPQWYRCRNHADAKSVHVRISLSAAEFADPDWDRCIRISSLEGIQGLSIGPDSLSLRARHPDPPNRIQRLLDQLGSLPSLEFLGLSGMWIETVPRDIRALRWLKHLSLSGLGLTVLPDWLGELPLESFNAIDNAFTTFPVVLDGWQALRLINLNCTHIDQIPPSLFGLPSIQHMHLRACRIREVPAEILRLEHLKFLEVTDNPIESPPPEVAAKGIDAIRDYWRQRADSGVDYLCEAKLIILGEPGAGKTSLARKLQDPGYTLTADEKSTEGINVLRFQFATVVRSGAPALPPRQFQVNVWDFGGQEIYHATHQFFLTRRSVYVLVCDDRKEDTDFFYWLHVVEMLSDGSPLLIVQNEKQDRQRDIQAGALRARFSNLRASLPTNLQTGRGLDAIVQVLRKELETLPHVGTGLPATWKRVREALEKDPRDHISLDEYFEICERNGFQRDEDKLQLSGYLHDLGICQHFQEDPLLKHTVVLEPTWGTDAVYRVLDDHEVIRARGRFTRQQLARIWSETTYAGMRDELLGLMMKFQLCYELSARHTYIAPQLLSSNQPTYPWPATGSLTLRYEYAFLPKGMLTRLIVALHHLIVSDDCVWKRGVVLERDGTRAEVIEDYTARRICVRVAGPDPRGLLAIVDDQLERLHASFPRLQYDCHLPCHCGQCFGKAEPHSFPLERLTAMAEKGFHIQCYASGELVNAAELIRSVLPGAIRAEPSRELISAPSLQEFQLPVPTAPLEVFVSYSWAPESTAIVDQLQKALEQDGIRLLRDRDDIHYKDSIRNFMRRVGRGKCVVVVLSKAYLESESCMFELLEIEKAQGLRERIFPIVMPDSNIYKPIGRVRYVQHWEAQFQDLDVELKKVRGNDLVKLQEDLNLYGEIRRCFDGIADTLRDMNALRAEHHESTGFAEIIRRIRSQIRS